MKGHILAPTRIKLIQTRTGPPPARHMQTMQIGPGPAHALSHQCRADTALRRAIKTFRRLRDVLHAPCLS